MGHGVGEGTARMSKKLAPALQQQLAELDQLRTDAEPHGITIEASVSANGLRFRFDHLHEVRAEYWPATQTLRLVNDDGTKKKTEATDARAALSRVVQEVHPAALAVNL